MLSQINVPKNRYVSGLDQNVYNHIIQQTTAESRWLGQWQMITVK